MTGPGRNDLCPCGSGRKYKKCCIEREAADPAAPSPDRGLSGGEAAAARRFTRPVPESSTDAILRHLGRLGVRTDQERFAAAARGERFAQGVFDLWEEEATSLPAGEADFLREAGIELWKRFLPGVPCVEILDERIVEGYDLRDLGREVEAIRAWLGVWPILSALLSPEVRTLDDASEDLIVEYGLDHWLSNLSALLTLHGDEEELAKRGEVVFGEIIDRFPEDRSQVVADLGVDRAALVGRFDRPRATAMLLRMTEEDPEAAGPWCGLAEYAAESADPTGLDRAIAMLEAALARPVRDAEAWSLEERIDEYRQEREEAARG